MLEENVRLDTDDEILWFMKKNKKKLKAMFFFCYECKFSPS